MTHNPLITLREDPPLAETPAPMLGTYVTPASSVYVRSNFPTPALDLTHRIEVAGAVRESFSIAAQDLMAMPAHTMIVTMECAGNDRMGMLPLPSGEPWGGGAVSTVEFTGVSLRTLLERAGVRDDVIEISIRGADHGTRDVADGPIPFERSIPLDVAMHPDTMLAWHMNGAALAPEHGAPLRLVVPRWYGMASVKWVTRIEARIERFNGHFQRERYVYVEDNDATPVALMRVKSLIATPVEGSRVAAGEVVIGGWAWSGEAPITRVEVAVGGGDAWKDAEVGEATSPYAWTPWRLKVALPSHGRVALRSRATDAAGNTQPDLPRWNALGYGNNAVRLTTIQIV